MIEKNWIGTEQHRIRVNEIDSSRRATLPALINLMQEVAWNNSKDLKYSVYDLMENGVTWVVYRMQIHIYRYPEQQELITVQSWPSGMDRLYTYRDYKITGDDGMECLRATSAWLVMDIKKRELVSVPSFIREGLDFSQDYEHLPLEKTKIPEVNPLLRSYELEVGQFHMDVNDHVYNTFYFQWLLETMREELQSQKLNFIDIQFKGESKVSDTLTVVTGQSERGEFLHQIKNTNTGNELIRARTNWLDSLA